MRRTRILTGLILAILVAAGQTTLVRAAELPGERIEFESRTPLRGREFFSGGGESVRVTGYLEMPGNASGPVPAVILQHCGDGIKEFKEIAYANMLKAQGYAVFLVDSYEIREASEEGGFKWIYIPMVDAYEALKILAKDPRIDAERIALLGWSNAGVGALDAQIEGIRLLLSQGDLKFAAAVAIQPKCNIAIIEERRPGRTPTLILSGEIDRGAPYEECASYAQRLRDAGTDITHFVYEGAGHNWSKPAEPRIDDRRKITAGCRMLLNLDTWKFELGNGQQVPWERGKSMSKYWRKCTSSRGVMSGYNAAASQKAVEDVTAFLGKHLKGS